MPTYVERGREGGEGEDGSRGRMVSRGFCVEGADFVEAVIEAEDD